MTPENRHLTMTAAVPPIQDISTTVKDALGHVCGSTWTSAVVLLLLDDLTAPGFDDAPKKLEDYLPEDASEQQHNSTTMFFLLVFGRLRKGQRTALQSDASGKVLPSHRKMVAMRARKYLNTFPGVENVAKDSSIRMRVESCMIGKMVEEWELRELADLLDYRNDLMSMADAFAQFSCAMPKRFSCAKWNPESLPILMREFRFTRERFDRLREDIYRSRIFPDPIWSQGEFWGKPHDFFAVVLLCAQMSEARIEEKLLQLSISQSLLDLLESR